MNIGFAHLDLFGWLGAFSSGPNTKKIGDRLPDPAASNSLHVLFLSCGKRDGLLHVNQELHAETQSMNVPHLWRVTDRAHDAQEWKQALYGYVQQLTFRR